MNKLIFGSIALMLTLFVFRNSIQIEYHRRSLDSIYQQMYANPIPMPGGGATFGTPRQHEWKQWHRESLVELGYFFQKDYKFDYLSADSREYQAFWSLVQSEFPDSRFKTFAPHPHNLLQVVDLTEREVLWDAFAKKHNIPDLAQRYLPITKAEE